MIVVRTPLRISFLGGGTDFREFYLRDEGCVLSTTIDKYVFVIIDKRFDDDIRLGYSRTEQVSRVGDLRHDLARESLRKTGIDKGVGISMMGQVPSGTGLGSSGAVTVGLLHAMYRYRSMTVSAETLAREACEIEIDVLGKPIGVQDQYIVAFGGTRFIRFERDGRISVESASIDQAILEKLDRNLMLFFTRTTRRAEAILSKQLSRIDVERGRLRRMKAQAEHGRECLQAGRLDEFGALLDEAWRTKRKLAGGISNPRLDEIYDASIGAGALGGKITGAGGGGFLLLYCPAERQEAVRSALRGLAELRFRFESDGSSVALSHSSRP
jgi:D-glycero-alpha-D-manno-heptose-7-phosphate kinase